MGEQVEREAGESAGASPTNPAATAATAASVDYGLWPMIFLGGVNLIDQTDMSIIRGIAPVLQDEWALNDFQIGLLTFVFVFVNAVATIPAGWLADNADIRRTRVIGFTMASWSGLILLSATAVNYVNMLFARAVMGVGQSFDDPSSTSLLGDYYPAGRRARAFSLQQIAVFTGMGLGVSLGGLIATTLGWRWAFVILGMPGALFALLAFRLPEPRRGAQDVSMAATHSAGGVAADGDGDGEAGTRSAGLPKERVRFRAFAAQVLSELRTELKFIFGIRTMRYILVGVSALLFTVAGVGTWLPFFHERYSGMSVAAATAVTGGVLGLGGIIGTLWGGRLSDRFLASRGPAVRIHITVLGGGLCSILFLASFAIPHVPLRVLLQFVGTLAGAAAVPGLRAAMLDVVPAQSRGVGASAFSLCSIVLGTALAPPLVGLLSHLTNLMVAFYIAFPPVLLGMFFLYRATHTIIEDAGAMLAAMQAGQEQAGQEQAGQEQADGQQAHTD